MCDCNVYTSIYIPVYVLVRFLFTNGWPEMTVYIKLKKKKKFVFDVYGEGMHLVESEYKQVYVIVLNEIREKSNNNNEN